MVCEVRHAIISSLQGNSSLSHLCSNRGWVQVLKQPQHAGRFNFTTQFPYYKEVTYKPDFQNKILGKPVVFDMDMSAGDFLALFYLLKVPVEVIDLKVY